MQVSRKKLHPVFEKQIFTVFYQALADLSTPEEMEKVFSDLVTETERLALAKRLAIAAYIDKGRSYENIRALLNVSSATVAFVASKMGDPGMQLILSRVKAEEWASNWAGRIARLFKKVASAN